jgi:MFS superfamily sulfate permease-like transporter
MLGVLLVRMLSGLLLLIGSSIVMLLTYLARPTISVLGQTSDGRALVDLEVDSVARPLPGMLILRPNTPLIFLNVRGVRTRILDIVRSSAADPSLSVVLLELSMTSRLDVEVLDTLSELRGTLREIGLQLALCNLRAELRSEVEGSGYFVDLETGLTPDGSPVLPAQTLSSHVYV